MPSGARFERLLPFGVHPTQVDPEGGLDSLLAAVALRARADTSSAGSPQPFAHWSIDGDHSAATAISNLTQVAYGALAPARKQLLARADQAIASGCMGPESLRSLLAHLRPADLGLPDTAAASALSHFSFRS